MADYSKFEAVLFDCDGTLVDSETSSFKAGSLFLQDFGLADYTPEKIRNEFIGWTNANLLRVISERTGVKFPENAVQLLIEKAEVSDRDYLQPIVGARDFLADIVAHGVKCAVASNGERKNVHRRLQAAGLMDFLDINLCFGQEDVQNGKPAPDLYLKAADALGVDITKCLVLEDSVTGALSGLAAGAIVWGFTGVSHDSALSAENLKKAGVPRIFNDYSAISLAFSG